MTDLIYNLTREQAAEKLNMSTRTIDRNIRRGVFSYKKISNKVFLSEQELEKYIKLQSSS
ncbi:MAG: helix-turn-helix domain-containing protein [Patescibacteria group bacterium]